MVDTSKYVYIYIHAHTKMCVCVCLYLHTIFIHNLPTLSTFFSFFMISAWSFEFSATIKYHNWVVYNFSEASVNFCSFVIGPVYLSRYHTICLFFKKKKNMIRRTFFSAKSRLHYMQMFCLITDNHTFKVSLSSLN